MNAQQIIDAADFDGDKNLQIFYPTIYEQKLADRNLTKCLRK